MNYTMNYTHIGISGGILITIVTLYLYFKYDKTIVNENKTVVNDNRSGEDTKLLFNKLQKNDKTLELLLGHTIKYLKKKEGKSDFIENRDKYFSPKISYHSILINSLSHAHNAVDTNNYNFTVDLSEEGYGVFKDVIGFRLIKCGVPNRDYQITDANNTLMFTFGGTQKEIVLTPGSYTGDTMAIALNSKMNAVTGVSDISVTFSDITLKFTFTSVATTGLLGLVFGSQGTNLHIILGFEHINVSPATLITSTNIPNFSIHYVDIICHEIPYIACKSNSTGNHVLERIGLFAPIGTMNYYENKYLTNQNFFTPILLSKLSIEILDDHGFHYESGETDMFFEFEITVMNHL